MTTDSQNPAFDQLLKVIDGLPKSGKYNAVVWAAMALGMSAEPTGLEPSSTRTIKQLFWDVEPRDLRKRCAKLVDKVELDERLIVEGTIAVLKGHFASFASPEGVEKAKKNIENLLPGLRLQLELPVIERAHPISDAELRDLIEKAESRLANLDNQREEYEQLLDFFSTQIEEVFTDDFWRWFESWRVRRMMDERDDD
jgi:hypothetical protein